MITDALECKAALNDTCDDHHELQPLKLSKVNWSQLEDIAALLKPFSEYTEYVSREEPTLQMSARMYMDLNNLLSKASKKQAPFERLDHTITSAVEAGIDKFKEYFDAMKVVDLYFLATILDPRIKTAWIRDNLDDAEEVIDRIRNFLKQTYTCEQELPTRDQDATVEKGIEYRFLEPYADTSNDGEDDIDRYLDSPRVKYKLKPKQKQAQWVLDWWAANRTEYPRMAQSARDYLAIPCSEVDIERLFNLGRDILGIRRFSMSIDTLRTLILLKDALRMRDESRKAGERF
jgi:hypothetical protein